MKSIFIKTLLLFSVVTLGQSYKLGEVNLREIEEKQCPLDTAAGAAYLFKSAVFYYTNSGVSQFKIHRKITQKVKIYKKSGYSYGTVRVPYTKQAGEGSIQLVSAHTYNAVDGKIVKEEIKSDGIFETELSRGVYLKNFVFPNVKEGSILEIEFIVVSQGISPSFEYFFQEQIPVLAGKLKTIFPDVYHYRVSTRGNYFPKVAKKIGSHNEKEGGWGNNDEVVTYEVRDIPALINEPFVAHPDNFRSGISAELVSLLPKYGMTDLFSGDWASISRFLNQEILKPQLTKREFYGKELNPIIDTINGQKERMYAIIDFLKSNVNWNEFEGVGTKDGIKEAYKNKVGNFCELNLLLVHMLRYAGVKADPVLISTRRNGIPLSPSIYGFNGVICLANINDVKYFIDATDKDPVPNILPVRDLNWTGRLVSTTGNSTVVDLMPKEMSSESLVLSGEISNTGKLLANVRRQHTNHKAKDFIAQHDKESDEKYIEFLESELGGAVVDNYIRTNQRKGLYAYTEDFTVEVENVFDEIAGKLYLKPLLFATTSENPFKQEVRESPIDFNYPNQTKFTYVLKIPEGYHVEAVPEPISISFEDNAVSYKLICSADDNTIRILASTEIRKPIFQAAEHNALKFFFAKIVEAEKQRIVLSKSL